MISIHFTFLGCCLSLVRSILPPLLVQFQFDIITTSCLALENFKGNVEEAKRCKNVTFITKKSKLKSFFASQVIYSGGC